MTGGSDGFDTEDSVANCPDCRYRASIRRWVAEIGRETVECYFDAYDLEETPHALVLHCPSCGRRSSLPVSQRVVDEVEPGFISAIVEGPDLEGL